MDLGEVEAAVQTQQGSLQLSLWPTQGFGKSLGNKGGKSRGCTRVFCSYLLPSAGTAARKLARRWRGLARSWRSPGTRPSRWWVRAVGHVGGTGCRETPPVPHRPSEGWRPHWAVPQLQKCSFPSFQGWVTAYMVSVGRDLSLAGVLWCPGGLRPSLALGRDVWPPRGLCHSYSKDKRLFSSP